MQKLLFTVPVLRTLRRMALFTVLLLAGSVLAQDPAQKLRIACAGDSITAGIGAANMEADSYPAQLQRLVGDAYEVLNFGVGGRTLSRQAAPYAFSPALQAQPDIVICTLGTNDCKPYCWPKHKDSFVKDYTELLLLFRKRNPAVKLFVGLPPPAYEDRWGISERVLAEEVRPAVRAVAEAAGAVLIDFDTPMRNAAHLFADKIHPNADGYAKMAEIAAEALRTHP